MNRPVIHRHSLHDALLHLCETPLTTTGELAQLIRVPVSTLHDQLGKQGLVDWRLHQLDALGARPRRRYFPTPAGLLAVGVDRAGLLRLYPVSKRRFRLLTEQLDSVAVLYHVAAFSAEADPERQRERVDHYRRTYGAC